MFTNSILSRAFYVIDEKYIKDTSKCVLLKTEIRRGSRE